MSHSQHEHLGTVLQQAGLVSADQLKQALEKQRRTDRDLKIGEILVARGYIDARTADFFAKRWLWLSEEKLHQPIGQYFKQAALLNESQIQAILKEQRQTKQKFGDIAIAKGWLKPTTVDFFLEYLSDLVRPESFILEETNSQANDREPFAPSTASFKVTSNEPFMKSEQSEYSQKVHEGFLKIKRKLFNIDDLDNYSEKTLDRVLLWTGGQSFLTQKLFELLADNSHKLSRSPSPLNGISENTNTPKKHQDPHPLRRPQKLDSIGSGNPSIAQTHSRIDKTMKPAMSPNRSSQDLEEEQIDRLVQTKLLDDWENNELGQHLKTIRNRLLDGQQSDRLLRLYQRILTEAVSLDHSQEQQELLNMGLVVRQQDKLTVANRIYQSVFNLGWVTRMLSQTASIPELPSNDLSSTFESEKPASRFKFKNILILITLVGLLTVITNAIVKRMSVKFAFRKGNELLRQRSFAEAIERYNQLLNIDSNYYQAWTNRGYAFAGLQQYEEMRESCSAATIIEPTAVYAWNCQGEALHNLQRGSEAIAAFNRAIALDRTNPIFLINKSEALKNLGRDDESLTAIKEAIQVLEKMAVIQGEDSVSREFAVALAFLGNGYQEKAQYEDAIAAYERALTYAPDYFPASIGKGIALNRTKEHQKAIDVFENILENTQLTETQQAQTWFYLGKALCESRQNSSGIAAFERSLDLEPSYQVVEQAKKQCY